MAADGHAPAGNARSDKGDRPSRLAIRSIAEVSQVRDAELAVIFTEMRRASGVTKEQIAGRLATSVGMIEALEEGALTELPEWREVTRIVTAYAAQLGLDARPILRRMQVRLGTAGEEAPGVGSNPQPAPPRPGPAARPAPARGGPPMPPSATPRQPAATATPRPQGPPRPPSPRPAPAPRPTPATAPRPGATPQPGPVNVQATTIQPQTILEPDAPVEQKRRGRAGRFVKGLVNWLLLIGFVAALGLGIWYAVKNPKTVWSALDAMPEPIPQMMRSAWEMVRPLENGADGSGTSDPDNRRSNKLP